MFRYALAAAALASGALLAAPASAIVPCQPGHIECYKNCYVPHYDKPSGQIYWNYC